MKMRAMVPVVPDESRRVSTSKKTLEMRREQRENKERKENRKHVDSSNNNISNDNTADGEPEQEEEEEQEEDAELVIVEEQPTQELYIMQVQPDLLLSSLHCLALCMQSLNTILYC